MSTLMSDGELINKAKESSQNSYSPYSQLKIGAALLADDGRIFTGTNIENSSYGLTICAERVALFKAVSEGARELSKLVVYCETDEPAYPCGACLQVLAEFSNDLEITVVNKSGKKADTTLSNLLTNPFKIS